MSSPPTRCRRRRRRSSRRWRSRLTDDRAVLLDGDFAAPVRPGGPTSRSDGVRPRQPDRRAHRLQRRLRVADLHSPVHDRGIRQAGRSPRPRLERRAQPGRHRQSSSIWAPSRHGGRGSTSCRGVTQALARAGFHVGGFDLALRSTVPLGSGLSSSAALAGRNPPRAARPLRADAGRCDAGEAGAAGRVDFVGAPVGIMDQMASSLAQPAWRSSSTHARWRTSRCTCRPTRSWPVINSGVAHNHAAGDYRTRRARSASALPALLGVPATARPGARDAGARAVAAGPDQPPRAPCDHREPARARRRCRDAPRRRHGARPPVQRVARLAARRLRVSVPEVDLLVTLAEAEPAVLGARGSLAAASGIDRWRWSAAAKPPASLPRVAASMGSASIASQPCSCRSATAREPRGHGGIRRAETRRARRIQKNNGFRRVFVLPSLPMPARFARTRSGGAAAGRFFANPAEQGRPGPPSPPGPRWRAGALAGPGAIWGGQADRAGRRP